MKRFSKNPIILRYHLQTKERQQLKSTKSYKLFQRLFVSEFFSLFNGNILANVREIIKNFEAS